MNISDERPEDELFADAAALKAVSRLPRLVCGWCSVTLREGPEPVSHGICGSCASKLRDAETRPAWKDSLGRLGKAQAIVWSRLSLQERFAILAEVDAETPTSIPQPDGDDGRTEEQEQQ